MTDSIFRVKPTGAIVQMPTLTAESFAYPDGWLVGQFVQTGNQTRAEIEQLIFGTMPGLVALPMERRFSAIHRPDL